MMRHRRETRLPSEREVMIWAGVLVACLGVALVLGTWLDEGWPRYVYLGCWIAVGGLAMARLAAVLERVQRHKARAVLAEMARAAQKAADGIGESTRRLPRIESDGAGAASLRPLEVPIFRSEGERAMWAAQHGVPPEVLPVQKRS